MKVAHQYRAEMNVNGFNAALLRDSAGYFVWARDSLEELYASLSDDVRGRVEVQAIYPNVNPAAIGKINEAADKLNKREEVNLESLLK